MTDTGLHLLNASSKRSAIAFVAFLLTVSVVAITPAAIAATLTVCPAGCDFTSIQAAHDAATAGDSVSVGAGTFTEQISITKDLTVAGMGPATTTIDGGGLGPVISVASGAVVTLESLTVTGGITAGNGAGVFNEGTLTLNNALITGNEGTSRTGSHGGGVANMGTLTITDSVISDNITGAGGGGVWTWGIAASATIADTLISNNTVFETTTDFRGGGGVQAGLSDLTITDSVIENNHGGFTGGGIQAMGSTVTFTMIRTTVRNNQATSGAGVDLRSSANTTITESTIGPGNTATSRSGGLRVDATTTVINTTISGNSANEGGGIDVTGALTLRSVTVTDNTANFGGGIDTTSRVSVLENTIVYGNTAGSGPDCRGTVFSSDTVLMGTVTDCDTTAVTTLIVDDPLLGPLQVNGGSTATHALLAGSPAIDTGQTALAVDQRGQPRPSGAGDDIGAFELQTANLPPDITGLDNLTVDEEVAITATPVIVDPENDPFTVAWSGVPPGASTDGDVFMWTPSEADGPGTYTVTVTASQDSDGTLFDTVSFDITVLEVNLPPTLDPIGDQPGAVGSPTEFTATAGDPDLPANDLFFSLEDGLGGTVPVGAAIDPSSGMFSWIPLVPGPVSFDVVVSDGSLTDRETITINATTTGVAGHITPDPGAETSTQWTEAIPLNLLDDAASANEILLITSTGSTEPVFTTVSIAQPVDVDVDRDGNNDLRATLRIVPVAGSLPRVVLDTERLSVPGPADVDVLAVVPFASEVPPTGGAPPALLVGFRTVGPGGSAGGFLPEFESIAFSTSEVFGPSTAVALEYTTSSTSNPLRFIAGSFQGNVSDGLSGAYVVSALVENPPSQVRVDFLLDQSALGDPQSAQATFAWTSPPSEPRPKVTFTVAENETRSLRTPDYQTVLVFDRMPYSETIDLTLDVSTGLTLTHQGSNVTSFIGVVYERGDGLRYDAGLEDAPIDVSISMSTTNPDLVVNTQGDPLTMVVEVESAGPLFASGAFNHPLRYAYASLTSFGPPVTITPTLDPTDASLVIDPGAGGANIVFVMADDQNDLRYPTGQTWPAGHPSTWPTTPGDNLTVGFADTPAGTTIAVRANGVNFLVVNLDAQSLGEAIAMGFASSGSLDVAATLVNGQQTDLRCSADFSGFEVSVDVALPASITWSSTRRTQRPRCVMSRGARRYSFGASSLPETTQLKLDLNSGPRGGIDITATDAAGVDAFLSNPELIMIDTDTGFFGPELLGSPIKQLALRGQSVPSTRVRWRAGGDDTRVTVESTAVELAIHELDVVLLTTESSDPEFYEPSGGPPGAPPLNVSVAGNDAVFRLWETPASSRLQARFRDTRSAVVRFDDSTGRVVVEVETTEVVNQAFDVHVPARGFFSDVIALTSVCRLEDVAAGHTRLSAQIPTQVRIETPGTTQALACSASVAAGGASPYDVNFDLTATDLPDDVNVSNRPGRGRVAAILSTDIGVLTMQVSGDLPGAPQLMGQPLQSVAIRIDDAPSTLVTWQDRTGNQSLDLRASDGAGAVQVALSSESRSITLGSPGANHLFTLNDAGTDETGKPGPVVITAAVRDLVSARFQLRDSGRDRIVVSLATATPRDLQVDLDTGAGSRLFSQPGDEKSVEASILVERLPALFTFRSDLDARHRVTSSGPIDLMRLQAKIDPVAPGPSRRVDLIAEAIPDEVSLDLARLRFTSSGNLGVLDFVVQNIGGGVLPGEPDRVRLRLEDLPSSLRLDTSEITFPESGGTTTGRVRLRGDSAGGLGRLLIEMENTIRLFSLAGGGVTSITADLRGVPARWTVDLDYNESRREGAFMITANGGTLDSINLRFTSRKSDECGYLAISGIADEDLPITPCAPTAAVELIPKVEAPASSLSRSAYQRQLDEQYFTTSSMTRMDGIYGRGVALRTTDVAADWGPIPAPLPAPPTVTLADQDHIIVEVDTGDPEGNPILALSAGIHGFSSATLTVDRDGVDISIDRGAEIREPVFVGIIDHDKPVSYPSIEDILGFDIFAAFDPDTTKNETIAVGSGETAQFSIEDDQNPATTAVVFGPLFGTTTTDTASGVVTYTPPDGYAGEDGFVVRACDAGGICTIAVVNITVEERYQPLILVSLTEQPATLEVRLDTSEQFDGLNNDGTPKLKTILEAVSYTASSGAGSVDVYVGPAEVLPVTTTPRRQRFRVPIAPLSLSVDLPQGGAFDTIALDSSEVISIQGVIDNGTRRTAFDFFGEDASWEVTVNGILADGDTLISFDADDFTSCDPIFGIPTCLLLFGLGPTLSAVGDATGLATTGTIAGYAAVTTHPAAPPIAGDVEFVPRFTVEFTDLESLAGSIEFQLDLFCFICPLRPLDIEASLSKVGGPLTFSFWDLGWNLKIPGFPDLVNSPDYLTGDPWSITP